MDTLLAERMTRVDDVKSLTTTNMEEYAREPW